MRRSIIIYIVLIVILTACNTGKSKPLNITPDPSEEPSTSGDNPELIRETEALIPPQTLDQQTETCEVRLNAQSVHDVIQIFPVPKFDLFNTLGALSISLYCDGDCPLLSIPVQGQMIAPDTICETDRLSCGVWYQVYWQEQTMQSTIGWISGQDEDVLLYGDCSNIPMLDPDMYFEVE